MCVFVQATVFKESAENETITLRHSWRHSPDLQVFPTYFLGLHSLLPNWYSTPQFMLSAQGASIPSNSMHIEYSPYSPKIYKFPSYFRRIYTFPHSFVQFTFFGLIYVLFLLPPILTMMHLCIMLYTYWTPLMIGFSGVRRPRASRGASNYPIV